MFGFHLLLRCTIHISLSNLFIAISGPLLLRVTGFKYYLNVIDDFPRYTWTFPLQFKSETTNTLQDFYFYFLNHFYLSIQCLQCDNGQEFDNHYLRSFFLLKGLFCAFLAPTIHPKMAKSDVVSAPSLTSCTLMFQAHLKPSYWLKHCTLPHTYPTDVLVALLIFLHHMKHSISIHLIILTSGPSVSYVSQILVPQTLTSYRLAPLLAHSLVIHVSTKATGASTSAPTKSSLPGT
jgi:hypothetical protein